MRCFGGKNIDAARGYSTGVTAIMSLYYESLPIYYVYPLKGLGLFLEMFGIYFE